MAGCVYLLQSDTGNADKGRMLLRTSPLSNGNIFFAQILGYSAVVNGTVAALFQMRKGMFLLGKNKENGKIPMWSYILWFPFYIPTYLYTSIHTRLGTYAVTDPDSGKKKKVHVPEASEVLPGWWIGGRYSHLLNKTWGGIIDLTVEFPELCKCKNYLCIPVWDGVPPSPDQLEESATFAVHSKKDGDVLIHCAHGRGRSTTVMCAALVKYGLYSSWQEAFDAVKPGRPVVKLNAKMKDALTRWQLQYIDSKKGK